MVTKFKNHLAKTNLAKNTVTSYVWTVQYFLNHYGEVNKKNLDLYSKGGKIRRLYIPKNLRTEAAKWLREIGLTSGYIFLNRFGQRITTRGIASQLKHFAEKYGMNKEVVYPHSFRHRFAKNFLDRFNDLALLADLMGHESIETTRIYLRRTASEQQKIVDKVVNW